MAQGNMKAITNPCIPFTIEFSSAITDLYVQSQNCWYDPSSGIAHLQFNISSNNGLIPTSGNLIAKVPEEYRPVNGWNQIMGYASVAHTKWVFEYAEGIYIMGNGNIVLNNWIYGTQTTYALLVCADYRVA